MNTFNDFPWNNSELVREYYQHDNIRVEMNQVERNSAIVFFSSNGIYYPNTEENFRKRIIKEDYYDWINISKNKRIRGYFKKIIFVRDLYKQWYVTGVNEKINSIDLLLDYLKHELEGYEITTCGSSAGGYASVLFGTLLHAEKIICNSAIFDIDQVNNPGPLIEQCKQIPEKYKYYNLLNWIEDASNIFYFYPGRTEYDKVQSNLIVNTNINSIMIDSTEHGVSLRGKCYPYVLTMDKQKLIRICNKYKGVMASKDDVYRDIVPVYESLVIIPIYKLFNLVRQIKSKGFRK